MDTPDLVLDAFLSEFYRRPDEVQVDAKPCLDVTLTTDTHLVCIYRLRHQPCTFVTYIDCTGANLNAAMVRFHSLVRRSSECIVVIGRGRRYAEELPAFIHDEVFRPVLTRYGLPYTQLEVNEYVTM
ncbi:hypothetical protein IWQ60_000950 [Tieghemiomyces parasiticus]|uniref:Uncharacterized protein n=1 Tax=Tieghemiomyces parasiticus TaxID=78921 RepID=A0A9W8ALE8_9FUNG|nr:hypothetical protein IWQ60_000950 [Tieghemiomyces parasiticus]